MMIFSPPPPTVSPDPTHTHTHTPFSRELEKAKDKQMPFACFARVDLWQGREREIASWLKVEIKSQTFQKVGCYTQNTHRVLTH